MRLLVALLLVTGCGSSPEASPTETTGTDVLSASGSLRVVLKSAPDAVPARGNNTILLTVTRAETGEAVDGLSMSMVPFMPAMGHGSPDVPSFSPGEGGQYHFDDVVLTMPGFWELRTSITTPEADSVLFRFDVD